MSNKRIFTAKKIFTGDCWLTDHSIIVEDGLIQDIVPSAQNAATPQFGCIIPAFIDLQIYGAYGKLLAVYPEADSLHKLYDYCKKGGAGFFQPTVATNTPEVFFKCIDAVRAYWNEGGKGCLGIHIEGPWINKIKRGAHIEELVHEPTIDEVKELLHYGKGVITMITLAPEVCSNEIIDIILQHNIIISAGHSNATFAQANNGFEKGITAVTHLFNAMSGLQHREPGLVGASFLHSTAMASIIPDGCHVDFAAIKIAKKIMQERLFAITDAVTETNEGYYPHQLNGDKYEASEILSGSALTMQKAVKNLIEHCDINKEEAIRMASLYPAKVMKLDNKLGRIEKGFTATMLATDDAFSFIEIIDE